MALAGLMLLLLTACSVKRTVAGGIPAEVESVIGTVSEHIAQERYEKVYNDSSELWKQDATLEQSTETLKTLHTKLGKVESRVRSIQQPNSKTRVVTKRAGLSSSLIKRSSSVAKRWKLLRSSKRMGDGNWHGIW